MCVCGRRTKGREGRCRIPFWRLRALWWRCGLENGLQVLLRIPGAFICPPCHWRRARLPGRCFGVSPRGVDVVQGAEVTAVEIIYYDSSIRPLLLLVLFILLLYQIIITPGRTTHTHRDVPGTDRLPAGRVSPPQMAQLTLPRPAGRSPTSGPSLPPSISVTVSHASSHSKSMYVLLHASLAYTGTSLEYSLRQPVAIRPDDLLESTLICFLSNLRPTLRNLKCVPSVQPFSCTPLTDTQCRKHPVLPVQLYL